MSNSRRSVCMSLILSLFCCRDNNGKWSLYARFGPQELALPVESSKQSCKIWIQEPMRKMVWPVQMVIAIPVSLVMSTFPWLPYLLSITIHFPVPVFFTSQVNSLHSNPCVRVWFWGTQIETTDDGMIQESKMYLPFVINVEWMNKVSQYY